MKSQPLFFVAFTAIIFHTACTKDVHENKVPIVDAGSAQSITLYVDSITVTGSATDADGKITAYLWSEVSGPDGAYIVNPGSASTKIDNLKQGQYIFQLMATDNSGATGVDTVTINVNPPVVQTLTLNPSNNPNEVQVTVLGAQNTSGAGGPEVSIDAWTSGGQTWLLREYFKFDLSQIPVTATIISANLYLYSSPMPLTGDLVHANAGTDNSMVLQQVTSDWSTGTIGWYSQPTVSASNQIIIPHSNQSVLDLNLDVKNIVASMISLNENFGFSLRLQNEVIYNSRIFVSSYNTTYPDKHPKLVVVYQ